ncbi:MAG: hypothetical protein V4732_04430 [Pseudomonadota bacterium]
MKILDIANFEDTVVLYFDTKGTSINAYTLASILVSIADAAKAANSSLNPGHDIEIIVEAFGEGSFKAQISALYNKTRNIFASQVVVGVIIGVLGNYIYERTLSVDSSIKVEVNTNEVIIERGKERLVVPRNTYEATKTAAKNPKFVQAIDQAFQAINNDTEIKSFGLSHSMESGKPKILLSRELILSASSEIREIDGQRIVSEIVDLQILKAILERGKRKWEFMWRGIKISAPITSQEFYNEFFNHDITIAPGDSLEVKLEIAQERKEDTGIYVNKSYEVVEVYKHHPRLKQMSI